MNEKMNEKSKIFADELVPGILTYK